MKTSKIFTLLLISLFIFSCSEDELKETTPIAYSNVALSIEQPNTKIKIESISNLIVTATNINSGKESVLEGKKIESNRYEITLEEGFYKIKAKGTIHYNLDGEAKETQFTSYIESTQIMGKESNLVLPTYIKIARKGDIVLAEIFFSGTQTPEGKKYRGDTYFVLYNNSDETRYADGIVLMESAFLTVSKYDYTPNVMNDKFTVEALYKIPGEGTQYPIKAGESIVICDIAINHKEANINSFDLTQADFEWYDESSIPRIADIDNPNVTNLEKIFCYSPTIWAPHDRGFKSYAIGRLPKGMTHEEYLKQEAYHYTYNMVVGDKTYPCERDKYTFPNAWIMDAVNLSVASEYEWIITSPAMDAGWTYCGTIDRDATRYGKSVRRKVIGTSQLGKKILKDTNNSSEDFDAQQTANPYYFK